MGCGEARSEEESILQDRLSAVRLQLWAGVGHTKGNKKMGPGIRRELMCRD